MFSYQKSSMIEEIIMKFCKSQGVGGSKHWKLKNEDIQVSHLSETRALKLAVSELPKSMFPWVKVLVNHVFLSKIFHDWRNNHEILHKSRIWGSKHQKLKNEDIQVSRLSETRALKLAASELPKSMLSCVKVLVKHVFLSKIFNDWRNNHEILQKSRI